MIISEIRESAVWAVRDIARVIEAYGPRPPGSEAEWQAQQDMASVMEPWADEIKAEGFTVHRAAIMGWVPVAVLLAMAAAVLFWFDMAWLGLALVLLALVPMVPQCMFFKRLLDPLFKARPSHNVLGVRRAAGETKKRILLVAHADTQYEQRYNRLGLAGMNLVLLPGILGLGLCLLANLARVIAVDIAGLPLEGTLTALFRVVGIVLFCLFPGMAAFLFWNSWTKFVPGAVDNLSGCYASMLVLKALAETGTRFEDTEVAVILSGCEEAGLRGAKAYVRAHRDELLDPDVLTVAVSMDSFRDIESMTVCKRDRCGTLAHSPHVLKLMKQAGGNCGYELATVSVFNGAYDAAAFTEAGVHAAALSAVDMKQIKIYHTQLDNCEQLRPEAIQAGAEVALETVRLFAGNGLPE